MDWILFEEWVRELDWMFLSEGRNVALVIDNLHGGLIDGGGGD